MKNPFPSPISLLIAKKQCPKNTIYTVGVNHTEISSIKPPPANYFLSCVSRNMVVLSKVEQPEGNAKNKLHAIGDSKPFQN